MQIIPNLVKTTKPLSSDVASISTSSNCQLSRTTNEKTLQKTNNNNDNNNNIVRVFAGYDMGWSRRSNGRQYDSLNGFGSLIGKESGLVLDFTTRNRKCRRCDIGHKPSDHVGKISSKSNGA